MPSDGIAGSRELDEGAANLSGGEAKRLSLCRVLVRPGELNLFDEPTAPMDEFGARRIWDVLFRELAGRTVICVTHDLDALDRFDRLILVLRGAIAAEGVPEKVKQSAAFRDLEQALLRPSPEPSRP